MSSQSARKSTESSSQFANINDQQLWYKRQIHKSKPEQSDTEEYVINTGFKSRYFLRHIFIAQFYFHENLPAADHLISLKNLA